MAKANHNPPLSRRHILAGAALPLAAAPVAQHPDATLLAVAALAFQAREIERVTIEGAALGAACKTTDALVRQMAAIPATTLDGFRAKAKVADWYIPWGERMADGDLTIDDVSARSLVRDLLAGEQA